MIPELPLHFLDLSRIEHPEYFETELRPFLELYRLRNNREEFENYMRFSEESSRMDDESWDILGEITHSSEMIEKLQLKSENHGEEKTMFKALEEFYNDGIAEGRGLGKAEGKAEDIIELLEELGEVSKELYDKIYAQKDLEILKKWHKLAAKVRSISEFEEKM